MTEILVATGYRACISCNSNTDIQVSEHHLVCLHCATRHFAPIGQIGRYDIQGDGVHDDGPGILRMYQETGKYGIIPPPTVYYRVKNKKIKFFHYQRLHTVLDLYLHFSIV